MKNENVINHFDVLDICSVICSVVRSVVVCYEDEFHSFVQLFILWLFSHCIVNDAFIHSFIRSLVRSLIKL